MGQNKSIEARVRALELLVDKSLAQLSADQQKRLLAEVFIAAAVEDQDGQILEALCKLRQPAKQAPPTDDNRPDTEDGCDEQE